MATKSNGLSLPVVRRHCLDCSGDSFKAVLWCSAYGCHLWRFRLGLKPTTVRAKYGPGLVTASMMPHPNVNLDGLPNGIEAAAAYLGGDARHVADGEAHHAARGEAQESSRQPARRDQRSIEAAQQEALTPMSSIAADKLSPEPDRQ